VTAEGAAAILSPPFTHEGNLFRTQQEITCVTHAAFAWQTELDNVAPSSALFPHPDSIVVLTYLKVRVTAFLPGIAF